MGKNYFLTIRIWSFQINFTDKNYVAIVAGNYIYELRTANQKIVYALVLINRKFSIH